MRIFGNKPDPDTQRDKEVADELIEDAQAELKVWITVKGSNGFYFNGRVSGEQALEIIRLCTGL